MQNSRLASILLVLFTFSAKVHSTYVPSENCTDRANTSSLAAIQLRVFPNGNSDDYTAVLVADALDLMDKLNLSKKTVLYIHGWTEDPTCTSVNSVLAAYFVRDDHNILVVNYTQIAAQEWNYCVASADGVGYTLATALDQLIAAGLDSTTLHVVGHSLGAQIAGYIGRYVNFTLPRITGLDPAGPSFTESDDHLSSSDATFVDIIHTDPGILGIDYSPGTVDFWPNGNDGLQPGCEQDSVILAYSCSHARSWAYFVESLTDEDAFIAVECESYTEFEAGSCSENVKVVMGYATPTTASGNFDLQTNSASPYGRKSEGIIQSTHDAYLLRQDHNILVIDWHVIAAQPYPYSALSVDGVGWTVANALNKLVATGLTSSTLHMVGHSLGAQTCGFIGRYVNFKLPRITGLDPAGPGFGVVIKELTFADAKFLDVIHTGPWCFRY